MNPAQVHERVEKLISAWIDQELTQEEAQLVEIHVADCAECARTAREIRSLRDMTAAVPFPNGPDERMDELGSALSVQAPRQTGWVLIVAGLVSWLGWNIVMALRSLRMPTPQEAISGAIFAGVVLLFVSVIRQRMLEYPHDRYRRVKR